MAHVTLVRVLNILSHHSPQAPGHRPCCFDPVPLVGPVLHAKPLIICYRALKILKLYIRNVPGDLRREKTGGDYVCAVHTNCGCCSTARNNNATLTPILRSFSFWLADGYGVARALSGCSSCTSRVASPSNTKQRARMRRHGLQWPWDKHQARAASAAWARGRGHLARATPTARKAATFATRPPPIRAGGRLGAVWLPRCRRLHLLLALRGQRSDATGARCRLLAAGARRACAGLCYQVRLGWKGNCSHTSCLLTTASLHAHAVLRTHPTLHLPTAAAMASTTAPFARCGHGGALDAVQQQGPRSFRFAYILNSLPCTRCAGICGSHKQALPCLRPLRPVLRSSL